MHSLLLDEIDSGYFMGVKKRRRSSAVKMQIGDYMDARSKKPVQSLLKKYQEKDIFFCDVVLKMNRRYKLQERILLITEGAIYNLDMKFRMRRRISLSQMLTVAMSRYCDNFVVLRCQDEYDYVFVSGKKIEITTQIQEAYHASVKKPLRITLTNSIYLRIGKKCLPREILFSSARGKVVIGIREISEEEEEYTEEEEEEEEEQLDMEEDLEGTDDIMEVEYDGGEVLASE
ncbi:hypothetical protein ADUPG1_006541 [Aduncisulcus paluster]|uniref:TH1 domain-containing protein n=1 Tax=Aduncisulcus paluster TaxID=2918883 RepID=A0ABQ5KIL6_9EUKA|nr:hypothetical protein ADUPG1_006541 [Aduncisulcus paluster]